MSESSQKFIARNRAPRVQIEYDVDIGDAQLKVELPFVMGIMADLAGKSASELPPVAERKFLEIDVDNFEQRLKALKPRVAFRVPNTLTGEGELPVDLTFESMDDFLPDAVARKVEPLRRLLAWMDGKAKAEDLVATLLQDPALLKALAAAPKPEGEAAETQQS